MYSHRKTRFCHLQAGSCAQEPKNPSEKHLFSNGKTGFCHLQAGSCAVTPPRTQSEPCTVAAKLYLCICGMRKHYQVYILAMDAAPILGRTGKLHLEPSWLRSNVHDVRARDDPCIYISNKTASRQHVRNVMANANSFAATVQGSDWVLGGVTAQEPACK